MHFTRSAMRAAKVVNSSTLSVGYHLFMTIAKQIPDEPSKDIVQEAFDVLSGVKSFETFSENLPPDISSLNSSQVDTDNWKNVQAWADWWRRPHVLKKLCKA